jgi:diaminopimelate decarboxylase
MQHALNQQIRDLAARTSGPFYVYDTATLQARCRAFTAIPYANKAIHFATMANASPRFLELVRDGGLKVFVNSPGHLALVQELGFAGHDIVYTASAMDPALMRLVHAAGAILNLDSLGQLQQYRALFPGEAVGLRCNIGDLVDPRQTRAGYFLGKESRLGLSIADLESQAGSSDICGLHLYIGTDLVELDYFAACYQELVRLARLFPALWFVDFGGGFGLPREQGDAFPLEAYGRFVSALMTRLSTELGRDIRLLLEPGRIIGGEAGCFVCRVTDVKQRNGTQLVGVNGSSAQFPRPLFYPDDAHHPVSVIKAVGHFNGDPRARSRIYGCSTYSRDFLARDVELPALQVGDLVVFGHAGSYCASAYTHFLGFPQPEEFFV